MFDLLKKFWVIIAPSFIAGVSGLFIRIHLSLTIPSAPQREEKSVSSSPPGRTNMLPPPSKYRIFSPSIPSLIKIPSSAVITLTTKNEGLVLFSSNPTVCQNLSLSLDSFNAGAGDILFMKFVIYLLVYNKEYVRNNLKM